MRIAILDPAAGISGDMTLAALLSLGLPVSWLEELPGRLGVGDVRVTVRDVRRSGITCKQVEFDIPPQPHGRHVGELVRLVERVPISDWVKERAVRAFRLVGEAEGRVHGGAPAKAKRPPPLVRPCSACFRQARRQTVGGWSAAGGARVSAIPSTIQMRCAFSSPRSRARPGAWCCSRPTWTT